MIEYKDHPSFIILVSSLSCQFLPSITGHSLLIIENTVNPANDLPALYSVVSANGETYRITDDDYMIESDSYVAERGNN